MVSQRLRELLQSSLVVGVALESQGCGNPGLELVNTFGVILFVRCWHNPIRPLMWRDFKSQPISGPAMAKIDGEEPALGSFP